MSQHHLSPNLSAVTALVLVRVNDFSRSSQRLYGKFAANSTSSSSLWFGAEGRPRRGWAVLYSTVTVALGTSSVASSHAEAIRDGNDRVGGKWVVERWNLGE